MPSSLIFASLVVLWLLILVPAVARRRQEVARPSVAALSGRVLERPLRHQCPATGHRWEADGMDEVDRDELRDHADEPDWDEEERDDRRWERPPPRYRPGRGGFDPEAAAIAARARYSIRQRIVLGMLIVAVVTGVVAAAAIPGLWWAHIAVDVALVGYLVYLRRQVRLEEAIRERRASRMAGTRRTAAADDPELDVWARRGRQHTRREAGEEYLDDEYDEYDDDPDDELDDDAEERDEDDAHDADRDDDLLDEEPERVTGTGEPLRARRTAEPEPEPEPALPRLHPAPPPALPAGTSLV
ncbi:MAG: hypothetical protein ACRDQ0_23365, partial [Pseudonocardia sp.]